MTNNVYIVGSISLFLFSCCSLSFHFCLVRFCDSHISSLVDQALYRNQTFKEKTKTKQHKFRGPNSMICNYSNKDSFGNRHVICKNIYHLKIAITSPFLRSNFLVIPLVLFTVFSTCKSQAPLLQAEPGCSVVHFNTCPSFKSSTTNI